MNLRRCINGHFYDAEKNSSCPICKSEGESTLRLDDILNEADMQYESFHVPFNSDEVKLSTAHDVILESRITKVVLHPDGAQVTQEVTYIPKKNCERIYVIDFPPTVELESLHINASRGLQCNTISTISCKVSGDFSTLETAEQRLEQLQSEYLFLQKKKEGLVCYLSKCCEQRMTIDEIEEIYQQTEKKNKELIHEEQHLKEKIVSLNEEIKKQKERKDKVFSGLELEVYTNEEKEYRLEFEYNTESAYWMPVYDVQSFSRSNEVSFSLKAKVFQNMGVDWKNISLTFSTGAKNNINITDLKSYKIVKKSKMMSLGLPEFLPSPDKTDDFECDDIEATVWPDETERPRELFEYKSPVRNAEKGNSHNEFSGLLKREFVMKNPYTIRAGSQTSVTINYVNKEIKKVFFAIPEKERHEYMGFHVKEILGMNLLSCNANIFLDGTYVGNKKIDPEKSEGLFVLGQVKGVYVTKCQPAN